MSKQSYQCGWKSISVNEQKNRTMSARHLLLTWVTGKQSMSSVQSSSLCLQTCEENIISKIKSRFVCLGNALKSCYCNTLNQGVGAQWARAELWLGPSPAPRAARPSVSSDAIPEIAQRRKEQTGTCGLCHMRDGWRLYSK